MSATKLDEVIETVLQAREDGPDALAAVAMSFGAAMELGTLGNRALKARLAETRAALEATEATVATLHAERDAACAELKAARESTTEAREDAARLRALIDAAREERDESRLRATALAQDLDTAVQEREAFGLRASAAERERDEARAERDALRARPTYEARTVAPTDAEWRGHFATGGSWLVLRPTWSPLVVVDPDTYPGLPGTQGATWLPLGDYGLPCAWPVVP